MPQADYSFIDIAVVDGVRQRFAAGDAIVVLSVDLEQIVWANGPGAALFGHDDVDAVIGAPAELGFGARRQIAATAGFPNIGRDRSIHVRLATGITSQTISFLASAIRLPGGESAVMLAVPATLTASRSAQEIAARAIGGFTEPGQFLAFVDGNGAIEAATEGFSALGITTETLAGLVAEVARAADRTIKRVIRGAGGLLPAGLVRLVDDPARHLLVVVDERQLADDEHKAPAEKASSVGEPRSTRAEAGKSEAAQHDHWYFSTEEPTASDRAAEVVGEGRTSALSAGTPSSLTVVEASQLVADAAPVRFVWRTDSEGRFSAISPEFAGVVGEHAADIVGRRFRDVSNTFALDPSNEIADLLERRDTWSGRSVYWPVAGTEMKIPVDLAALPVYSRDRSFEGFRGFGVARAGEAVPDPERIGLALVPNATPAEQPATEPVATVEEATPLKGEVPALSIVPKPEQRFTDKVISLAEHRQPAPEPANGKGLSTVERSAFREIGERLKKVTDPSSPAPVQPVTQTAKAEVALPPQDSEEVSAEIAAYKEAAIAEIEELGAIAKAEQAAAAIDEARAVAQQSADDAESRSAPVVQLRRDAPPLRTEGVVPSALFGGELVGRGTSTDTPILEELPVPLLIHSGDVLHYANAEFLELTGYASVRELEDAGGLGALFAENYAEDADPATSDHALRLKTRDGAEFPIEAILRSVPWRGGKALMLVVRRTGDDDDHDLGVDPGVVAELETRLAEMRTIIDTATDGVVLLDGEGLIRSISRPAEALFGFDSDEVTGKPFASLFAIESQRAARDYLAGLLDHGVASVLNDGREVIGREAQGRFIPLFMTIGRLPDNSGFCAVVRDITQWKRAEEELTQARAVAERASSQKTDFLARISHEIRTPLNAIIGFSELMMGEKFGPVANDRYRDYLRDINRSGNHVLDLVNDLLDISKIEAGQQEMDYEAVSLNDTLSETVALMQPQANRERVIIRSSFASRLPEVVADLRSVRQIALNILSNAIRYTQAGGQVIVSTAYETSGDIVMRVRDTGIGMTQAEIEQALKPFKQINSLKRARGDGTGLGLPLTKAMVEANRARFSIASTPGEGTLVEITFPSTRVLAE